MQPPLALLSPWTAGLHACMASTSVSGRAHEQFGVTMPGHDHAFEHQAHRHALLLLRELSGVMGYAVSPQ